MEVRRRGVVEVKLGFWTKMVGVGVGSSSRAEEYSDKYFCEGLEKLVM